MAATGVAARRGAVKLLDQVLGQQRMLSDCVAAGFLDDLPLADRARAQRLALETLRGLERADRLLSAHLRKPPPLTVRNALRLGTVELCQGEAAHGVVNAMVTIVSRQKKHGALKGLVNAVLRKVAADGPEKWASLRVPRLPKWLRGQLVSTYGPDGVQAIEAAHFRGAPLDLTRKGTFSAEELEAELLPTGSLRLAASRQVSALPGYEKGEWWVQDAAAAIAARVLAPATGVRVLDLCAAPGGKTLQLAAMGAAVTAVDLSEDRLKTLRENLDRTGLNAEVRQGDVLDVSGSYDAILLDAPCSATGTIRRHPDLPHVRDGSGLDDLVSLQAAMLDHAWGLLRPGGRLVYCTCSLFTEEGEHQIENALTRHSDMAVDPSAMQLVGVESDWVDPTKGIRLRPDHWPDRGGMDGFFISALVKS
ncbi:MAG: methyltransferase domain-containing protein [Marinibacterium sp.]|nr:methyltransferase domain-containing protein [Marinibacterium sp.]